MGIHNSAITRVRRILGALLQKNGANAEWALDLWRNARTPLATAPPHSAGEFTPEVLRVNPATGLLGAFERPVPPPAAFLHWLILHPEQMTVSDRETFGTSGDNAARKMRAELFSNDPARVAAAQDLAVNELQRLAGSGSSRKWWAFEGYTYVDCALETETFLLFIEGKRTEPLSPSTRWFKARNQVWRNVEAAAEMAPGKAVGVILAVEDGGEEMLRMAMEAPDTSLPHLSAERRDELAKHLLGVVTWKQIVDRFALDPKLLTEVSSPS
jgi:hypothetical protein